MRKGNPIVVRTPSQCKAIPSEIIGARFGRATVREFLGRNHAALPVVLAACDCGTRFPVLLRTMQVGNCRSCGCLQRELVGKRSLVHGDTVRRETTAEYRSWASMIQRCHCKSDGSYPRYGGRGIKVVRRWRKFANFLSDMGRRPSPDHSIDRINNSGNYQPGNCRWATDVEQGRNKRNNVYLLVDGVRMLQADAWRHLGFKTGSNLIAPIQRERARGNTSVVLRGHLVVFT